MNKIEFNKLPIVDQLEYVNSELIEQKSLRNISSKLNISKTTIRDRLKKIGYVFDSKQKQYIKKDSVVNEYKYTTNINKLHKNKSKKDKSKIEVEYKDNINIFNNADDKNKLLNLLGKYDNLVEMLQWFDNKKNIEKPIELTIDSNKLVGEVKATSVRLHSEVWDNFKKFMNQYKEFKNMDMVNMALVEFMEKYKNQ